MSPAKSAAPASAAARRGARGKSFLQEKSDLPLLMGRIQIKTQAKMASLEQKVKGEGREARLLFIYPKARNQNCSLCYRYVTLKIQEDSNVFPSSCSPPCKAK